MSKWIIFFIIPNTLIWSCKPERGSKTNTIVNTQDKSRLEAAVAQHAALAQTYDFLSIAATDDDTSACLSSETERQTNNSTDNSDRIHLINICPEFNLLKSTAMKNLKGNESILNLKNRWYAARLFLKLIVRHHNEIENKTKKQILDLFRATFHPTKLISVTIQNDAGSYTQGDIPAYCSTYFECMSIVDNIGYFMKYIPEETLILLQDIQRLFQDLFPQKGIFSNEILQYKINLIILHAKINNLIVFKKGEFPRVRDRDLLNRYISDLKKEIEIQLNYLSYVTNGSFDTNLFTFEGGVSSKLTKLATIFEEKVYFELLSNLSPEQSEKLNLINEKIPKKFNDLGGEARSFTHDLAVNQLTNYNLIYDHSTKLLLYLERIQQTDIENKNISIEPWAQTVIARTENKEISYTAAFDVFIDNMDFEVTQATRRQWLQYAQIAYKNLHSYLQNEQKTLPQKIDQHMNSGEKTSANPSVSPLKLRIEMTTTANKLKIQYLEKTVEHFDLNFEQLLERASLDTKITEDEFLIISKTIQSSGLSNPKRYESFYAFYHRYIKHSMSLAGETSSSREYAEYHGFTEAMTDLSIKIDTTQVELACIAYKSRLCEEKDNCLLTNPIYNNAYPLSLSLGIAGVEFNLNNLCEIKNNQGLDDSIPQEVKEIYSKHALDQRTEEEIMKIATIPIMVISAHMGNVMTRKIFSFFNKLKNKFRPNKKLLLPQGTAAGNLGQTLLVRSFVFWRELFFQSFFFGVTQNILVDTIQIAKKWHQDKELSDEFIEGYLDTFTTKYFGLTAIAEGMAFMGALGRIEAGFNRLKPFMKNRTLIPLKFMTLGTTFTMVEQIEKFYKKNILDKLSDVPYYKDNRDMLTSIASSFGLAGAFQGVAFAREHAYKNNAHQGQQQRQGPKFTEENFKAAFRDLSPYEVLGVNKNAPLNEIKKKYKRLRSKYHPDKSGSATKQEVDSLTNKFHEAKIAFEVIKEIRRSPKTP